MSLRSLISCVRLCPFAVTYVLCSAVPPSLASVQDVEEGLLLGKDSSKEKEKEGAADKDKDGKGKEGAKPAAAGPGKK